MLARAGDDVVIAQLTSQDHDRDAADEARFGRFWFDVGTGGLLERAVFVREVHRRAR